MCVSGWVGASFLLTLSRLPRFATDAVVTRSAIASAEMLLSPSSVCLLLHTTSLPLRRAPSIIGQLGPDTNALAILGGALARIDDSREDNRWELVDGPAWMLAPKDRTPWAAVHFVGGAALGTAPQVCYDFLLSQLVERTGVAILATPYDIGTDHWALSRSVHAAFVKGLEECRERSGLSSSAPTFRLGHSLGAKLIVLGEASRAADEAASSSDGATPPTPPASLGLLAFNNFGLADSVALASDLLGRVQGSSASRAKATARQVLDAFNVVQGVAQAAGLGGGMLEISPTPEETASAVSTSSGFAAPTTLWRFGNDNLDSSDDLLQALPPSAPRSVAVLEGTHLSPVVFRLAASEIDPSLGMLLGAQSFSFGSEEAVAPLVDTLCEWLWPTGMAGAPRAIEAAAAEGDGIVDAEFIDVTSDPDDAE